MKSGFINYKTVFFFRYLIPLKGFPLNNNTLKLFIKQQCLDRKIFKQCFVYIIFKKIDICYYN